MVYTFTWVCGLFHLGCDGSGLGRLHRNVVENLEAELAIFLHIMAVLVTRLKRFGNGVVVIVTGLDARYHALLLRHARLWVLNAILWRYNAL